MSNLIVFAYYFCYFFFVNNIYIVICIIFFECIYNIMCSIRLRENTSSSFNFSSQTIVFKKV